MEEAGKEPHGGWTRGRKRETTGGPTVARGEGTAFSATYYAGPLGLTLVDAEGGLCMLSEDVEPGTQSVRHNLQPWRLHHGIAGSTLT